MAQRTEQAKSGNIGLYTIDEKRSSLTSTNSLKNTCAERKRDGRTGESLAHQDSSKKKDFLLKEVCLCSEVPTQPEEITQHETDPAHFECVTDGAGSSPCSMATDSVPTDVFLKLIMVSRKTGLPDSHLQEILRGRLRILENDTGEVVSLFGELSARLLSIHSKQDLIVVTFKTFEEIWKFSTYYSLGFIGHCLENLLFDHVFWLQSLEKDEAWIDVQINEDALLLMYRGLLIQEGMFYASYHDGGAEELKGDDADEKQHVILVEDTSGGYSWTAQTVSDGRRILAAKSKIEPLIPFHQWFLKTYCESVSLSNETRTEFSQEIATGSCVSLTDYEASGPEELSFQRGDSIEIVGILVGCLHWFVGRHMSTGKTGFVRTNHVKPEDFLFLSAVLQCFEDEKYLINTQNSFSEECTMNLLKQMSRTDVNSVYRMEILHQLNDTDEDSTHDNVLKTISEPRDQICKTSMVSATNIFDKDASSSLTEQKEPRFCIGQNEDSCRSEILQSLLLFLNSREYNIHFKSLYDFSFSFLHSLFYGYHEEEDLVYYLELAREAAKKKKMNCAQARICYLLGRLCARKMKFSQARVYFEEAIGVNKGDFTDVFLLTAVYSNLTCIYLKQKNKEKASPVFEKLAALLLGMPKYICSTEAESEVLRYVLKKAILTQNQQAEVRICILLITLYTSYNQHEEALPFIERLLLLSNNFLSQTNLHVIHYYFILADLYNEKCLPHLAASCVNAITSHCSCSLTDCMKSMQFLIKNSTKLFGLRKGHTAPAQLAPYLRKTLSLFPEGKQQLFCKTVYLSLSELCRSHGIYEKSICYMKKAIALEVCMNSVEVIDEQISLAWLYILSGQDIEALAILFPVLESCSSSSTHLQKGIAYNMSAICLRRTSSTKKATENYFKALCISDEMGLKHNQAIVQANIGFLFLHLSAHLLAEYYLLTSVKLFCRLQSGSYYTEFIQVLLSLGQQYVGQRQKERGQLCYEWALLVAISVSHINCQLQATQKLCDFYRTVVKSEARCIIYNEYQLQLAKKMGDKELEGSVLETISKLYMTLGTERSYRSALENTKRSLGIFIDLQKRRKEAYAWLQAGKIYYMLRQNELVDLYIQVAQDTALNTGDRSFALELLEATGDIFFNGTWDREKAVTFYRDWALPIAVKAEDSKTELRLCNKLVHLLLSLKAYNECLEHAQTALVVSAALEDKLNERVAYHRLAAVHQNLGQCELAEHFYLKTLSLCSSPLQFDEEALYYVNVYINLGDIVFYELKDPFDAAGYYHLALAAAMDLNNKKAQLKICTKLATIYHNFLMDRSLSLFYYQKARTFATELNIRRINLAPDRYYQIQNTANTYFKNCT
ncbi:SH3 domain and tetratricopeptide repeat-containing protein 1 isoform X2 [Protopterus annectens]|uniref:SH3 domain and tetratricopeptide repeat-containing protein 1 isoform X2 n=1 Tax=Protopterus annectens TaxID=7888 RepID=UPI001CFB3A89|nr:SH3 domain and tetratricopeptide repeat-containing protein 1 isoform X2 [Protopterus annectens]